jgi:hypothetical protein
MARGNRSTRLWIAGVAALVFGPEACHLATAAPGFLSPSQLVASIPPRDPSSLTGSQLMARLESADRTERSRVLVEQILAGNIPTALRRLRGVEMSAEGPDGVPVRAVVWVMPDYLAVGSDEDFVRVPLGLADALTVARRFGFTLPTRKIVDTIHRQAEAKLDPRPMPAGPSMTSVAYLRAHNETISGQQRGFPPGTLVSGSKKDVVLTPRLAAFPGKVAIYGWLRPDGAAIQPLSTVHVAWYADYSHGIRLVSDTVFVDGQARSVFDLLEDPARAGLLSDEGVDRNARRLLAPEPLTVSANH